MKSPKCLLNAILAALILLWMSPTLAHDHHAKHNMVLVGENEIFASHIVYKAPHNFQVILRLSLSEKTREKYLAARKANPQNLLIFLLGPTDISQIGAADSLRGDLLSEDSSGNRTVIESGIQLEKKSFQLLYFDELPLSLGSST